MHKWNQKNLLLAGGVAVALIGSWFIHQQMKQRTTPATSVDFLMDTIVEQKLYGKDAERAVEEVIQKLLVFEEKLSMYQTTSEISVLNRMAGLGEVELSEEVYHLLERSKELSAQSQGAFDLTIGPLTLVWGITSEQPHVPSAEEIQAARELVSWEDLSLHDGKARLEQPGQMIDLGGIAKGAACDIVRQVAKQYHITVGYASIGGNLVVLDGKPRGKDFRFGIRDPNGTETQALASLELYGKTMATTGGYERFFEQDGVIYHHVLSPETGYPAETDLLSVSVICEDGTLADFLSTTLFVLGKEQVLQCLERSDFEIVAVGKDNVVYCSSSLEGNLVPAQTETGYTFQYGGIE